MERKTVSLPTPLFNAGLSRSLKIRPYTFSNYVATLIEKDIKAAPALK